MSKNWRGDTIVEVLLAITIAAFGLGITYATAQRGLDQTITAREHNQALNWIENQVTDLRLRYQNDSANFEANFGTGGNKNHFCLDDKATTPSSSNWLVTNTTNSSSTTESSPLTSPTPYNTNCQRSHAGDGVTYFVDIQTTPLTNVLQTGPHTLYQIFVRWERAGGGPTNQASNYFRINGGIASLGNPTSVGNPPPPSCPLPSPNPISETDPALKAVSSVPGIQSFTYKFTDKPYTNSGNATPWLPNPACTYIITISTHLKPPIPSPPQNNEQLFIQFCNSVANCEYTSTLTQDINEPSNLYSNPLVSSYKFSGAPINYLKVEHCSLYPGGPPGCKTQVNRVDDYDINVAPVP